MSTAYPGSLDNIQQPGSGDLTNAPSHAGTHDTEIQAIQALEAKVGTGASTPTSNTLLYGNGSGSSAWTQLSSSQLASSLTDETGSGSAVFATSPTLTTPVFSSIVNTGTLTLPTSTDTLVGRATTDTLTNKTFNTANNTFNTDGWQPDTNTYTYSANNGNKEFVLNANSNPTGYLSPGMKFKVTRGTVPSTQCMAFASASSQYATKASPSGISFTSAFTCEAWVYLNSYTNEGVIGRSIPGTSGFIMYLTSSGQVVCYTVPSQQTSYQSVPLHQWTHIAVTYSSGTMVVYVNGTIAPSSLAGSGSSFTQGSGPLQIGAYNSTNFFDGYISEARVWSAAQTQANIQANMAINLTGSETNLVALFQGGGNFNDKTSNANNLTATNSAIATQAANPYNAIEYGIITKVTSSQITVFTGTSGTIPNQTLNSPQYSIVKSPYGFPTSREKWRVEILVFSQFSASVSSNSTWYNPGGMFIAAPTGEWSPTYSIHGIHTVASATTFVGGFWTLSTANNSESNSRLTKASPNSNSSVTESDGAVVLTGGDMVNTAMTNYYVNVKPVSISGASSAYIGANSDVTLYSAYV